MRPIAAAAAMAVLLCASPSHAFDGWHQTAATVIEGKGSAWDYLSFDAGRLFIGHRKEGLQVFDVRAGKLVTTVAGTAAASSNGATLMPAFDLGVSNGEDGTIIPFSLSTLAARAPVKLGDDLDSSHYDPASQRLVVNMGSEADGTELVVLDVPSLAVAGRVKVPTTKAEGAAADGKGGFWLAARDLNALFKIDVKAMAVTARFPTTGCAQANSVAVDPATDRVFVGCRGSDAMKPSLVVMDGSSGAIVFKAEIGGGNDSIVYDPDLHRVFMANGVGAVINVFEQTGADAYKPVESLGTRAGVRTLTIDPTSKTLYAVWAEGSADPAKKILTTVSPFYANTFTPDTFTVLSYARPAPGPAR